MNQLMSHRDRRITLMDEVLSGIKAIKLYAWEIPFIKRINKVRVNMELEAIRKVSIVRSVLAFVTSLSPFVVSFATFGFYTLMDNVSRGPLTPQLAFVSLTLFNMLRGPLEFVPKIFPDLIKARVSHHRILRFMTSEEIDSSSIEHLTYDRDSANATSEDVLVSVQDGFFEWPSNDEPVLRDINIQCRSDELVAVIGRVGSGKTSLVSAILGDLNKCSGRVKVCGSTAYVAQESWILNATLRDNILFSSRFDQEFYDQVIDACALRQDVDVLPAGDMTEIGERGINLSGGQKMRVSLARAVYARADVYILDDPLAAVDAHVSKHIFTHVLGPQGLLRSAARILVTNAVQYLSDADNIIMLQDGTIIEQGSFAQAMSNQKDIAGFIQTHAVIEYSSGDGNGNAEDTVAAGQNLEASENMGLHQVASRQSNTDANPNNGHALSPLRNQQTGRGNRTGVTGANARTTTTELKQQGRVEWSTYRVYFKACGLRNVGLLLIAMLLAAVGNVLANSWLEHWSSLNAKSEHAAKLDASAEKSVIYYLVIYGIFGLVGASSSSLKSLVLWTRCSISASTKMHQKLLRSVLRLPMSFFDATPLGRIINRFSTDMNACDESLPEAFYGLTEEIIKLISAMIIIGFTTPPALIIVLILILIYRQLQQLYLASSRELRRIESITRSPIFAHFQESIRGISTIRAYILQSRFIAENENRIAQNIRAYYTSAAIDQWLSVRLNALGNILVLGITLVTIALLHLYGIGSAGLIGLAITYAFDFTSSLHWLTRYGTNIENAMTHIERINEYTYISPEAADVIDDYRPKDEWPEQGEVEFKNYSTRYREGLDLVLKDLSFRVQPRQKVGIVGRTGAGKSSLTMALFRIIEAAGGQILLDGEDISQYGLFDVRSKLSIIPQDPVLFAGTVRENLDPFGNYNDQEIWRALEQAHLADYIRSKDERLEFMVAPSGENFSMGQKQLICLARALLKRAKVLILDEATAAIDNATDEIIQQTIRTEFKNCTVLTIAHRLNTIIDSDMVLVIDGGRLAEYDTPQNLLANKDSIFTSLVEEAKSSKTD
ncbi:hypothetical protein H4R20_000680 [Coemansia guatemalensis]|uniref:P-loop containing nucleoside triphosphate hydrolase protein n=1 Tax=Coemansia guatemalensis TaxID=2761395 RepID=A0A9W8LV87_9FUNG|nr:hypothetical protein H4R20_000680 [Coemansia guatemalensis]